MYSIWDKTLVAVLWLQTAEQLVKTVCGAALWK